MGSVTLKPIPSEPSRYITFKKDKLIFNGGGLLTFGLPTLIFIVILIIAGNQANSPGLLILFVLIFIVMIFGFGLKIKVENCTVYEKIPENEYDVLFDKYSKELKRVKKKNKLLVELFEKEKKIIDTELKNNYESLSKNIYLSKLKPSESVIKINTNNSRGRLELMFLEKLYSVFGNQIIVDCLPNFEGVKYRPDFVIISKNSGLIIDVEIDEPYSVEQGIPIHHDRSNDNDRNNFFTSLNWVVIRFSEKQIATQLNECCDLITKTIQAIENKTTVFTSDLNPDKSWTYEQALIMSNTNYRNEYLPENMKVKIKFNNSKNEDFDELPF